ncbi:MAG: zinc-binding alcohol dehydrogenase [Caldilineaceae bacterium]|nr:zinc-binding alcohol dehydrogenase [Caldilineaceae bacterium]
MMTTAAHRLILTPTGDVEIEDFVAPAPGPDQVRVRVHTTQVSAGSEINGVRKRRQASAAERATFAPAGMGYTAIGVIDAVGRDIEGFAEGERVLCGGNHATHWLVTPGAARNEAAIPQEYRLEKLPPGLSDEAAAFCVLGDVALHGVRRAQIQIGEAAAIHGLGVIGQIAAQLCRLSGAYPVIGVDLVDARMALARQLGASHTIDAAQQDVAAEIRSLTQRPWRWRGALPGLDQGAGADVQIHTTSYIGNYPVLLQAAADRGRIVLVGATSGSVAIESHELFRRELQVLGSYQTGMIDPHPYWPWTRTRNQHVILDLIRRGELHVEPLISHVVPFTEAPALYEQMAQGGDGWMSVFFKWG